MKTLLLLGALCGALISHATAGIEVRLSVKFIYGPGAMPPVFNPGAPGSGNIDLSNSTSFDTEVTYGNGVLDATARAYQLRVIEYINIQPPDPANQPAGFWYNLDARENRRVFEQAAAEDSATWARNGNGAINIYINNSSSGSCSFVGTGDSITLGATIFSRGTVLHELGHFFDLSHTHGFNPQDPDAIVFGDGDGLSETLPDQSDFAIRDQLCMANYGGRVYADPTLTASQRQLVDDTWFNVMSYHVEARLLPIQMDYWTINANHARQAVCTGRTWFVSPDGFDFFFDGLTPGTAFQTFEWGLAAGLENPNYVHLGDDVLLLRTGEYSYTGAGAIETPGTLTAAYGPVTITRP